VDTVENFRKASKNLETTSLLLVHRFVNNSVDNSVICGFGKAIPQLQRPDSTGNLWFPTVIHRFIHDETTRVWLKVFAN
jgi:hypothetical protein